jgi:hypothetical protein
MSEKLPAPSRPVMPQGLVTGGVCGECQGNGHHLFVNENRTSVKQDKPQRWQRQGPL